jgi:hypothetical protein
MPATAHWAYFSMQRALYDKGSAQGKQPEKRARRSATAVRCSMALRYCKVAAVARRALSNHLTPRIMAYGLFPTGAART